MAKKKNLFIKLHIIISTKLTYDSNKMHILARHSELTELAGHSPAGPDCSQIIAGNTMQTTVVILYESCERPCYGMVIDKGQNPE